MLHIHGRVPDTIVWAKCVRKPTVQRYSVLMESANVETEYGTAVGRAGDILMEGIRGAFHVLTREDFAAAYDVVPDEHHD